MIINIDTNEESPQRLREIAAFLQKLAGEQHTYSSPQETNTAPVPTPNEGAFDMFDMSSDRPSEVSKPDADDDSDGFRMIPY